MVPRGELRWWWRTREEGLGRNDARLCYRFRSSWNKEPKFSSFGTNKNRTGRRERRDICESFDAFKIFCWGNFFHQT